MNDYLSKPIDTEVLERKLYFHLVTGVEHNHASKDEASPVVKKSAEVNHADKLHELGGNVQEVSELLAQTKLDEKESNLQIWGENDVLRR